MNQEYLKQNDFYKTSDLSLATTIALYYPIEAIEKTDSSGKAYFLFRKDEKLDELIQKYWTHQLLVEPVAFFNCLKEIKTRIYNI